MTLSRERIEELRRLLDVATKSPWMRGPYGGIYSQAPSVTHTLLSANTKSGPLPNHQANELAAIAAVNALPALLDTAEEAQRLREALEEIRDLTGFVRFRGDVPRAPDTEDLREIARTALNGSDGNE